MTGWELVPVDDAGYRPAAELLALPDADLMVLLDTMRTARYHGWRNDRGRWRAVMGLDEITGKRVLDFGCGTGLEAAELAVRGNQVTVADLFAESTALARRACALRGAAAAGEMIVSASPPVFPKECPAGCFDVFYACGSLHHSRYPVSVLSGAHRLLAPGGQARLMLYSDRGWRVATGTAPSLKERSPERDAFIRFFDGTGDWSDWYDEVKLARACGGLFCVEQFSYLAPDDRYCGAVLRRLP